MVTGIVIARQLGPELRGEYGLVILAVNLLALGHLGLGPAITYFTGKNKLDRGKILTFTIGSSLFLGTVFATIFYFVYPHIPEIWTDIPRPIILIGLVSVPFYFLTNFFTSFLMGLLKVKQYNIVSIIRGVSRLLLVVILIWIFKGKVIETTISFTSAIIIACMLGLFLFTRDIKPARITEPSFIKPFLSYGFKVYIIIVFHFLNYRLDIFLIKHFLTTSDVGFYQIAVGISESLWYIPTALNYVLLPTLLIMREGSSKFTAKVCRNSFVVMLILAIVLILTGKFFIILLYGEEYTPSAFALYSIMWGIVVTALYKVIFADFSARRRLGVPILGSIIGVLVNLAANLYMIPRYGIVGAGISTSLSYSVLTFILIGCFMRHHKMRLRELIIPNREDLESYREGLKSLRAFLQVAGKKGKGDKPPTV
ncbi:MAG: oligosaccharide flippase family protein [Candidatus Krumholzibacteria bacterium]|nr:oligosaccharide flippase family protein [Candidatus Krumholzibacteria bacterium]